jgi:hypothetical protein
MAADEKFNDNQAKDWLRSLMILHRGHWNAARKYDKVNFILGIVATIMAAVSGTTFFSLLAEQAQRQGGRLWLQIGIGLFSLIAAGVVAVQTFFRSSELAMRHKRAAVIYGKLRRELEEKLDIGLPVILDEREKFLTSLRERWNRTDDESPPVPERIYRKARIETEKKLNINK